MIDVDTFEKTVSESPVPFVVLFWGGGCGPCERFKPIFTQETKELEGFKFVQLKVNDNYKLAGHYGVKSVPSLVKVNADKSYTLFVGPKDKEDLYKFIGKEDA